jgi:lipopolysaccharide biosynthesis protein
MLQIGIREHLPMIKQLLKRTYTDLTWHFIPRTLRRFGYKVPRYGRKRSINEDFSMAVPFSYAIARSEGETRIAVICHLFYPDLSAWLLQVLRQSGISADIYISTDTLAKKQAILEVLSQWKLGEVTVCIVENRGRDIAPKILTFSDIYDRYDLMLFLHSKKSTHYDFGEAWRDYLVQCVAGSRDIVDSILEIFARNPNVGMVVPPHYYRLIELGAVGWGVNFRRSRQLAKRMGINISIDSYLEMPSGSIFWARPQALRPILDMGLSIDDFASEYGQIDGTLAHCIERLFLFACEKAGFTWVKVTDKSLISTGEAVEFIDAQSQIEAFIARHRFDLLATKN